MKALERLAWGEPAYGHAVHADADADADADDVYSDLFQRN